MRSKILIRCGIASLLIGGGVGGLFAAGCGSDDNGGSPGNADGGDGSTTMPGDDGSMMGDDGSMVTHKDGGPDADAAPPPVHGKLILVHASSFAPPLRFCFGLSPASASVDAGPSSIAKTYPAPNNAVGLPPGTGGAAADTSSDLKDENITIFAINATIPSVAGQVATDAGTELKCDQLVGANALAADAGGLGLVAGRDYWNLGTLPAGTLADGTTTLVTTTGCVPGADMNAAFLDCPTGYNTATGDLGLAYAKLDTTTAVDGGVGAQFAYASLAFSSVSKGNGGNGAAVAGFVVSSLAFPDAGTPDAATDAATDGGDAAPVEAAAPVPVVVTTKIPIANGATYGSITPTTLATIPGLTFDNATSFFAVAPNGDGGISAGTSIPLPSIQALSYPGASSPEFFNGAGYVFILVGNPLAPAYLGADGGATTPDAGTFSPLTAHILGFPVNPPFGN